MGYLVLARKYRPDTFPGVVGQEPVARTLQNALKTGRLAHAYLFTGPRGVGKTSMARILARALQCEAGPTPEPCGTCDRCRSVAGGNDLDVIEIDGASNRGIENIRDLRESVRYAPNHGRFKVYIVDEVHQITSDAFNAFLKTLEEPPPHVVFVFATTEPAKVPETIRSRCQEFEFRRIPEARIAEHLRSLAAQEGITLEEGVEREVARHARGGLRDALSLLDQLVAYGEGTVTGESFRELTGFLSAARLADLFDALAEGEAATALEWVSDALDRGSSAADVMGQLLQYLRALLHQGVGNPQPSLLQGIEEERRRRQADAWDPGQLLGMLQLVLAGRRQLRDVEDGALVLEMVVLALQKVAELPSLEAALRQLSAGAPPPTSGSRGAGSRTPSRAQPEPGQAPVANRTAAQTKAPPPVQATKAPGAAPTPERPREPAEPTPASFPSDQELMEWLGGKLTREAPSLLPQWKRLIVVGREPGVLRVRQEDKDGRPLDRQRLDPLIRKWTAETFGEALVVRPEEAAAPPSGPAEGEAQLGEIRRLFGGETLSE